MSLQKPVPDNGAPLYRMPQRYSGWGINMCGAADQMIAEGMERGLAQGTERGIKNLIEVCQELGTSYDNVQFQVEMKYNLSQEEAERYMKQYWK